MVNPKKRVGPGGAPAAERRRLTSLRSWRGHPKTAGAGGEVDPGQPEVELPAPERHRIGGPGVEFGEELIRQLTDRRRIVPGLQRGHARILSRRPALAVAHIGK